MAQVLRDRNLRDHERSRIRCRRKDGASAGVTPPERIWAADDHHQRSGRRLQYVQSAATDRTPRPIEPNLPVRRLSLVAARYALLEVRRRYRKTAGDLRAGTRTS